MKRRILIALFGAIFFVGVIMALNRDPAVSPGVMSVISADTETPIKGYEVSSLHNGKQEEKSKDFDVKSLAGQITAFEQQVKKNPGSETVTRTTNMSVGFSGRYCDDIKYSVYDLDGNLITGEESSLNLPTKDIDGCVVKVDVKWGREKNYKEYYYFFRINYVKSE